MLQIMPSVFFHIQDENDSLTHEHFMSRILMHYVHKGNKVCVICLDESHATKLSKHIWSFPPDAFLPHHIKENMIITEGPFEKKCVINMTDDCILKMKINIIELVFKNETAKAIARDRFKIYKTNGFNLEHIKESTYL